MRFNNVDLPHPDLPKTLTKPVEGKVKVNGIECKDLSQLVSYEDKIAINGKEICRFEKHSQDVTCVAFRKDGLNFASGAKDNLVYSLCS